MSNAIRYYFVAALNPLAGWYMLTHETLDPVIKWILLIGIPLAAILTILSLGIFALGWVFMMHDTATEGNYAPGKRRPIELYDATVGLLKDYSRTRFYVSFVGSLALMAGISAQGWMFILVLEILGSAIGYGFIHWVMNNVHRMHERAYGSE